MSDAQNPGHAARIDASPSLMASFRTFARRRDVGAAAAALAGSGVTHAAGNSALDVSEILAGRPSAVHGSVAPDHVKVFLVVPSDGSDTLLTDGTITKSFRRVQEQLVGQTGGVRLRVDPEVKLLRLPFTRADMLDARNDSYEIIGEAIDNQGQAEPNASYVVYYDGPNPQEQEKSTCGLATERLAVTYLVCDPLQPTDRYVIDSDPMTADRITIHEVAHSLVPVTSKAAPMS